MSDISPSGIAHNGSNTDITDNARADEWDSNRFPTLTARAQDVVERRYYDEQTGTWTVTVPTAFMAGAEWAVARTETATDTTKETR